MNALPSLRFPHGEMPTIGLGTWKMDFGAATAAVKTALEAGYRHIDCAHIYLNENHVGKAFGEVFRGGSISRSDVWVTSKLWCNRHRPDLVRGALETTLKNLQLDYLDLYMIHWPIVFRHDVNRPKSGEDFVSLEEMPIAHTWAAMEECVQAGLVRNLGVCNFSSKKLQSLLDNSKIKPAVNQVECHPFFQQSPLLEFCQTNDIHFVAYSPLGSGDRPDRMKHEGDPNLFDDPTIKAIAADRQFTTGQVMLAWAVNRGTATIPKSANPGRMAENLAAGEIDLTEEEMALIDGIQVNHRYVHGRFWEQEGSPYTVANIWDE